MKCQGKNCKGCKECRAKKGGKAPSDRDKQAMVAAQMAEKLRGAY